MSLLTCDLGGTNARLVLHLPTGAVHRVTERPSAHAGLGALLRHFLSTAPAGAPAVFRAVLAVCGPTWDSGRKNESNNIPTWCAPGSAVSFHDASVLEAELSWSPGTLSFLNDFEAIGHGISSFLASSSLSGGGGGGGGALDAPARLSAAPAPPPSALALVVGAGTGLGACILAPGGSGSGDYAVFQSEAGMAAALQPHSEAEARLLAFLRRRLGSAHVEVEAVVSGPGISALLDWLCTAEELAAAAAADGLQLDSETAAAVARASEEERPAVICAAAQSGEPLCLRACDLFLRFYGRWLGACALSFLPFRGLFIAGGVLGKFAWRLPCLGARAFADDPLLEAFLDQGPKMSNLVRRVPLWHVADEAAGLKGCAAVAAALVAGGSGGGSS